jgi:hypothetical protein
MLSFFEALWRWLLKLFAGVRWIKLNYCVLDIECILGWAFPGTHYSCDNYGTKRFLKWWDECILKAILESWYFPFEFYNFTILHHSVIKLTGIRVCSLNNVKPKRKDCAIVESKTVKIQILGIEDKEGYVYFLGGDILECKAWTTYAPLLAIRFRMYVFSDAFSTILIMWNTLFMPCTPEYWITIEIILFKKFPISYGYFI